MSPVVLLRRLAAGLSLAVAALAAAAEAPSALASEAAERQRLTVQRRLIEAEHDARELSCAERFAVTSCVDDNRDRRRQAVTAIDAQLVALDDRQRARRAAARRQRIEAKLARQAKAEQERASAPLLVLPANAAR